MSKFNPDTYWKDYAEAHAKAGIDFLTELKNVNLLDMNAAHERLSHAYIRFKNRGIVTKKDGEDFNLICAMASIFSTVQAERLFYLKLAHWDDDFFDGLMRADIPGTIRRHKYLQHYYSEDFSKMLQQDSNDAVSYEAFRLYLNHMEVENESSKTTS